MKMQVEEFRKGSTQVSNVKIKSEEASWGCCCDFIWFVHFYAIVAFDSFDRHILEVFRLQ